MASRVETGSEASGKGFLGRLTRKLRPEILKASSQTTAAQMSASAAADADSLAASLPSLILEAERIAATVAAGLHGQRRSGPGETFWQYRPALPGEAVTRIDWRQSARSHRAYVRETEAEHAQTVYLWCDLSPSMVWTSLPASLPLKRDRAILLLLATASLLERSGERVRLLSPAGTVDLPPGGGRIANRIALALLTLLRKPASAGLPPYAALPTHAQLVMASDLIAPASEISTLFRQLAGNGIRAHILQIFDPAEYELPYAGRIRFEGLEGEPDVVLPAVETLREDFATLFNRQQSELRALAERCLHVFQPHRTDMSAATALLTLSTSLTGHRGAGRS